MPKDMSQLQRQLTHSSVSRLEAAVAALRRRGNTAAAGGGRGVMQAASDMVSCFIACYMLLLVACDKGHCFHFVGVDPR